MRLKTLHIALTILILPCVGSSGASAQPPKFYSTRGKEIIQPDGKPVLLKGINLGNWLVPEGYMFKFDSATSPRLIEEVMNQLIGPAEARKFWEAYRDNYITRSDIALIKRLGFNSVRVPFNWRMFLSDEDLTTERRLGIEMLERVVGWCKTERVGVILDMHCAPGGQTGDNIDDSWGYPFLFEQPAMQDAAVRVWTAIAKRFAREPVVIGYDLLNEPIAHYFDAEKFNPTLESFYRKLVAAVRTVDTNHILFLGGSQWDSNFKPFGRPFDTKLVYTFHKYWTAPSKEVVQEYLDFRDRYNVPIWMGESGENRNEWIDTFRVMLEQNNVGWCFWPYKKMNATSCIVSFQQPVDWALIKKFADAPRGSFASLRSFQLDRARVRAALNDFVENAHADHSTLNEGYVRALGLGTSKLHQPRP